MHTHRRLALRIINELMPAGNASNLRLTICKLMHSSGDCLFDDLDGAQAAEPTDQTSAAGSCQLAAPCERVFTAVVRATISAFKIGCANSYACDRFLQQLRSDELEPHEQLMLAREAANPTAPRGIAKMDIPDEARIVVFLITGYIVYRNGQINPQYLRELADALDIKPLLAERLIQTIKQSINERTRLSAIGYAQPVHDLMLA